MKKLLVVLLSAAMVLSLAAVSMAANVKGDFRYEFTEDESQADNNSYGVTDLRVTVEGALSDSVSALGTFQLVHGVKNDTTKLWQQGATKAFDMNEYYVTYKQSWGSVKAGMYEYKFTPSRCLLKSAAYHVWPKVDVLVATTFKTPVEGLTADVLVQPYAQKEEDDGAYGVSVAYNAEKWGIKGTYADLILNDADLMAIDAYYMITDTMKVFVDGVDYNMNNTGKNKYGIDGIDPVLGFSWDKIAGTKLFAAVEYAFETRYEGNASKEFDEYAINVKYKFNNKTALEIEHTVPAKDQTKDIFRMRYQF